MKIFKYRLINHLLFWIFIFAFYTAPRIAAYGFTFEAFVNHIYIPVDIVTVYFVIEFLLPRFVLRKRNYAVFVAGTAAAISLNILLSQFIMFNIQPNLGFWVMKRPFVSELFNWLVNNFMITGTATALKLFSYSHKMQLAKSELERRGVQSELSVLRSQINPHFLFNVLNNIDSLIYEDKDKASNAIFMLSKIMRYMLKESNEEKTLLQKEMEYIQNYMELAKLSFEDPGFLQYSCSGEFNGKEIPPLLFIPVIENTMKHCNKQVDAPGITISCRIEENSVELKTSNYIRRNDFKLPDAGAGNGLKNVEKRLKLLFGDNYIFEIRQEGDKFDVHLKVPLL